MDCKKRIAIVNHSQKFCEEMKEILEHDYGANVVGIAHDGEQAIRMIREKNPDLLLLDLLLTRFDGITVLDMIMDISPQTTVFATTGFISEYIISALKRRGVHCLFQQPCDTKKIADRMINFSEYEDTFIVVQPYLKDRITNTLDELGVPANLEGYHYLCDAITLVAEDMDQLNDITGTFMSP